MDALKTESYSKMYIRGIFLILDSLKSTEKKVYLCVVGVRGVVRKDHLCGRTVYSLGLTKGPLMLLRIEGTGWEGWRGGEEKNIDIRLGSEYF